MRSKLSRLKKLLQRTSLPQSKWKPKEQKLKTKFDSNPKIEKRNDVRGWARTKDGSVWPDVEVRMLPNCFQKLPK